MIKLLLVEDDANLSYIIQGGLEDMIGDYEVCIAHNGEEGLEAYRKEKPDIIVADIEMPVMDGYEMVQRIRKTDKDIPILFSSARVSPKDVVKETYQAGNYTLDITHATLAHASGSSQLLTPREVGILGMLFRKPGEVVRREVILDKFWNTEDDYFASRSLDVFVTKLRKLLSVDEQVKIKTVKGIGLMLVEEKG